MLTHHYMWVNAMQNCPYCNSELNGRAGIQPHRQKSNGGRKSTGSEFVSCPDCGGTIDGFTSH